MKRAFTPIKRILLASYLAASVGLSTMPLAFAGPGDVNSTNHGQNIESGTYYNTRGGRTKFVNGDGGLILNGRVRLLESDINGNTTGNGGTGVFSTTGIFRLNGTIDASGLIRNGVYTGNGGKVIINAPMFYQNGTIYANGMSGGMVQISVGSMVAKSGSKIYAKGFGGYGGKVDIEAAGVVDLQKGVVINTSGKPIGYYDANVISIKGGLVNNEGLLIADSISSIDPDASAEQGLIASTVPSSHYAGTIHLSASGVCDDCFPTAIQRGVDSGIISSTEAQAITERRNDLVANHDGDVVNSGTVQANGNNYSDNGGDIFVSAVSDIINSGTFVANGSSPATTIHPIDTYAGKGGNITFNAYESIINTGTVQANGGDGGNAAASNGAPIPGSDGGDGGRIGFQYGDKMVNDGLIQANGGRGGSGSSATVQEVACNDCGDQEAHAIAVGGDGGKGGNGGLIAFAGPSNPTGTGTVQANGGQGGNGGDATALSAAGALGRGNDSAHALARAEAYAGNGGEGGGAGRVLAPDPVNFAADQNYESKQGGTGNAGTAYAKAIAIGLDNAAAVARAVGNSSSHSEAIAATIDAPGDQLVDPRALADALGFSTDEILQQSLASIESTVQLLEPNATVAGVTAVNNNTRLVAYLGGDSAAAGGYITYTADGSRVVGENKAVEQSEGRLCTTCLTFKDPHDPITYPCEPPEEPPEEPPVEILEVPPQSPPQFPLPPQGPPPGIVFIPPAQIEPPVLAFSQEEPEEARTPDYEEEDPIAAPLVADEEKRAVRGYW